MDLTTLARTKAYLGGNLPSTSDAVLSALISRASEQAMSWCARTFQSVTGVTYKINGTGTERIMLPVNPVIDVSAVTLWTRAIQKAATPMAFGYDFDTKFLYFNGGSKWDRGFRNVAVTMSAGFKTSQTGAIPANPGPYTITPIVGSGIGPDGSPDTTGGPAVVDRGVVYQASGVALTLVGANPAAGQYAFADGVYTFAAADAGLFVTMTYDYVPGSVEQAVLEMVGTAFERRKNLGVASRTLASETVTYDPKIMTEAAKDLLNPYRFLISP